MVLLPFNFSSYTKFSQFFRCRMFRIHAPVVKVLYRIHYSLVQRRNESDMHLWFVINQERFCCSVPSFLIGNMSFNVTYLWSKSLKFLLCVLQRDELDSLPLELLQTFVVMMSNHEKCEIMYMFKHSVIHVYCNCNPKRVSEVSAFRKQLAIV